MTAPIDAGVTLDFIPPGKSTENGFIESFNSKLRDECLNANKFLSIEYARSKIEAWRGGLPPAPTTQRTGSADTQ